MDGDSLQTIGNLIVSLWRLEGESRRTLADAVETKRFVDIKAALIQFAEAADRCAIDAQLAADVARQMADGFTP